LAPTSLLRGSNLSQASTDIGIQGYTYPYPFTQYPVLGLLYDETVPPVYPYKTVGKLFGTLPGVGNFSCSAAVSRPHLVLTARHCIYDVPTATFATNVIFFPGWHNGPNITLAGGWGASGLFTWPAGFPQHRWDIGYIQTFDDDGVGCGGSAGGTPIESYTGFLGYLWGGDYSSRHWDEFGYPAGPPFDGTILIQSESSTGAEDQLGEVDTVEVGNSMTGGSSGGPWIVSFVPGAAGSVNWVNGLNSFRFSTPNHSDAENSPKFLADNFDTLRAFAEAQTCP